MQLSKTDYYPICLDFKFHRLYSIWTTNEVNDGLVADEFNRVIGFKAETEMRKYATQNELDIIGDLFTYNIFKLRQWVTEPNSDFDCEDFLNFWNLCTDISASVNKVFSGDLKNELNDKIYDKLFHASGTFISEDPNPTFDSQEILVLAEIIENGLALLLDNLIIRD